jgi:hypothetical protein
MIFVCPSDFPYIWNFDRDVAVWKGAISLPQSLFRAIFGVNCLPEAAKRSTLIRFLLQFHNILIYVLIGCAAEKTVELHSG